MKILITGGPSTGKTTLLDDLEKVEVVDKFQNHLLHLNQAIPHDDELYDVAELEFFPSEDDFKIYLEDQKNSLLEALEVQGWEKTNFAWKGFIA